MTDNNYLLAKFGEREYLEMLSNGYIYFNPISKYRNDTTVFRGDNKEGLVPIDPSELKMFDKSGQDIFNFIPRPTTVMQSIVGDDSILTFCASIITENILYYNNQNYVFTEDYKSAIKEFGEYVLLFSCEELLTLLRNAQINAYPKFGFTSGPIIYRDLNDFTDAGSYRNAYNIKGSVYDPYFVKSSKYKNQNEWRLIVDGSNESLPTNDDGSYIIKIDNMKWANLCDTNTFLNTFSMSV
ncbi:hypothetical protein [Dehalobacter sp. TBBPA1]|uniref:hypothetical protein n=1 Tax=Dehalobacter sp. TBBPA1 TaxID=3235037 RepID=UPI0034A3F524